MFERTGLTHRWYNHLMSYVETSAGRVLIIFPGALGDLICATPAIRVLAQRHPRSVIEIMARAELARFAADHLIGAGGGSSAHSIDRREVAQLFGGAKEIAAEARTFFACF